MIPTTFFVKIGDRLINPNQIASAILHSDSTIISLSTGEKIIFRQAENAVIREYFLAGSRTVDLDSIYGKK